MVDVDWDGIAAKLFERWGSGFRPLTDKADVGKLLAISIGLGALFNENEEAERQWMQTPHAALKTRPITVLYSEAYQEVLDQVNKERGL